MKPDFRSAAVDGYLSNLESVWLTLKDRELSADQWQRLGRIVEAVDEFVRLKYLEPGIEAKAAAFDESWASLHDMGCGYPEAGCSCHVVLLQR